MLPASWTRAGVLVLLAGLLGALSPATSAHAADRTVSGGRLDWGLKSSFQRYVTGPIAQGSWSLDGGAATVGESQFRFHSAQGSYDPGSGSFSAAFSGGVRFVGHRKPDGAYELDLRMSRLTVRTSTAGSGTLYADMVSKAKGTGTVTHTSQVPLASLDLSGVNMRGGGTAVVLNSIPTTLTARGAQAFAGYYTAGTQLDPLSLSADMTSEKPDQQGDDDPNGKAKDGPNGKAKDKDKNEPTSKGKPEGDAKGKTVGKIQDAALDWGVRRTFREYVTGPIAKGAWKLSQGAQDGGALFRFPTGKGSYDQRAGTLDATFIGRTHFTGDRLDLALSGMRARVADGRGTLLADVTTEGATRRAVPLATFDAKALLGTTPKDGLLAVTEAPTRLTKDGAKAFNSMYQEGTAMDPLSLAVATNADAKLPPLPDLGSEPTATPTAEGSASPVAAAAPGDADGSDDSGGALSAPVLATGTGVLLAAGAAVAFVTVRRRHAAATADAAGVTGSPSGEGNTAAPAAD
ncbi:HtaA domain-containing protein [Streptomyces zagrosensis]|uniref:Htaa domain-containing protein n=1 Tax=Streptomyces zagrosensis TaxID=1042984 RepID=A0A7W9UWG3_9ACTN|nr:HtaA domain-containing protein [Streptomyces zagrosensis]MBB5933286.1 hypothetical protein [Streptomyces zagrosensis]